MCVKETNSKGCPTRLSRALTSVLAKTDQLSSSLKHRAANQAKGSQLTGDGNKETMRIQAYLRVCGDEATIRSIHKDTNVPSAAIQQLKAARNAQTNEMSWDWSTARAVIDVDNADDGFKALLKTHRDIFPKIRRHSGPETDVYLEIVTEYVEGEEPRGLYLSAETILLLSELGAAVDNDVLVVEDESI